MFRRIVWAGIALLCLASAAYAERPDTYDKLIAAHAAANGVPESLVHRVIVRESRYNPRLIGHCGCLGLMQIKLGTARSLGYEGNAQGLLDPETNLTYGVKYLAGAYRTAVAHRPERGENTSTAETRGVRGERSWKILSDLCVLRGERKLLLSEHRERIDG